MENNSLSFSPTSTNRNGFSSGDASVKKEDNSSIISCCAVGGTNLSRIAPRDVVEMTGNQPGTESTVLNLQPIEKDATSTQASKELKQSAYAFARDRVSSEQAICFSISSAVVCGFLGLFIGGSVGIAECGGVDVAEISCVKKFLIPIVVGMSVFGAALPWAFYRAELHYQADVYMQNPPGDSPSPAIP